MNKLRLFAALFVALPFVAAAQTVSLGSLTPSSTIPSNSYLLVAKPAQTSGRAFGLVTPATAIITDFNTRKGSITLLSADVTAALGYTPLQASAIPAASGQLLGGSGTAGQAAAITIGSGLNLTGTTLTATGVSAGLASFQGRTTSAAVLTLGDVTGLVGTGSTAQTNLGLGGAALLSVGTTNGTVADAGAVATLLAGKASLTGGVVAVANGGTGTTTPGIVAGTNVTVTGTWPNQTVNSTAAGGGVNSGTSGQLGYYATTGTTVSALNVGSGLTLSGGALTASGGTTNIVVSNTYTTGGAIAVADARSVINNASAAAYTLADGTVDGHPIAINNFGAGTATLTIAHLNGAATALTLIQGAVVNLFWNAALSSYLYAS